MGDKDKLISNEPDESLEESPKDMAKREINSKAPWYFANGFLIFWGLLFFAVVIPLFNRLPTPLSVDDANKGVFIGDRAHETLYNLANIGVKVVGSDANEKLTVDFLLNELAKIKADYLDEYFDLEVDLQQPSGAYLHWTMINMYQGIQNIVVKLTPKNSSSTTYLLVNSHFDSKPNSPAAGDAGHMIVSMLEVIRVLATTKQTFDHPIVFLFNGAEENPLQASHAFITQHKWAPYCKAFINLDAAGSGGREIVFQTGPENPWLIKYYKKYAKHPYATTVGEEIFQSGIIPSDTDFRHFRDYGNIPGLDLAQFKNGFVYHTKYDRIDVIPRGALQNTGDNVLSLVRGLANASELYDTQAHATGHAIFFDFLGLFVVSYTESDGEKLNYTIAITTIILVFVSLWRMAAISQVSLPRVVSWFIPVQIIQIIGFVLGLALPVLVAYIFDSFGLSLTYFSSPWMLIGLYICPSLIGLSLPITIYYNLKRNNKITMAYHLQMALHGQAIILALLCIGLTAYGIRSTYIISFSLIFYTASLALNLLTTLHDRGYSWSALVKACQFLPFLYISYLFYTLLVMMIPMMGRFGSGTNPDLIVSVITALGTILALGFCILLINMFRRPCLVLLSLVALFALTTYAATTQMGFPYRPKTNVERLSYLHVRRVFYEYDGTVSKDESGYYFDFQDRRVAKPLQGTKVNLTGLVSTKTDCDKYMMCGMPLFNHRWVKTRLQGKWLPRADPIELPDVPQLELLSKTVIGDGKTVHFEFELSGPPHMSLFIQPNEDVTMSNWSFLLSYLAQPTKYPPPYHIYFSYGIDSSPLKFFLELSKPNGDFNVPLFQLGVSGHYITYEGDINGVNFVSTFPAYADSTEWPASYQRYIF